jgi:hypothetical protein
MKTLVLNTPDGKQYTIREQNGEDDDIVSNMSQGEAEAINRFVQSIIVKGPNGAVSLEDVESMPLRTKYYILIKSRIFSLGDRLYFKYKWADDTEVEYEELLEEHVGGENTPPSPSFEPYQNYTKDYIEVAIEDSKFRFKFLDGKGEKYLLELKPDERVINKTAIARGLQFKGDNGWVTVNNFKMFSSRILNKLRTKIEEIDPPVTADAEIQHPQTLEVLSIPLIAVKDFFFPVKF